MCITIFALDGLTKQFTTSIFCASQLDSFLPADNPYPFVRTVKTLDQNLKMLSPKASLLLIHLPIFHLSSKLGLQ